MSYGNRSFSARHPQNTGNILRTCALTGSALTLVPPLGFSLTSRHLKRSGLDYWEMAHLKCDENLVTRLDGSVPFYFFSSFAKKPYTEIPFTKNDLLIFGSETKGLPAEFKEKWPDRFYTIPMVPSGRCLNLSNSVAIVLYEAWRQLGFQFDLQA